MAAIVTLPTTNKRDNILTGREHLESSVYGFSNRLKMKLYEWK